MKIYSYGHTIEYAAASITVYGARIAKGAKLLKEYSVLKSLIIKTGIKDISKVELENIVTPFIFEHLIDSIKIGIFFENYIKAQLLLGEYLIHNIDSCKSDDAKRLASLQKKKPISLREVNDLAPFIVDNEKNTISNEIIKETTLSYNLILNKPKYKVIHKIDSEILSFLNDINSIRNGLHFHDEMSFTLSNKLIQNIESINVFIDDAVNVSMNLINKYEQNEINKK